jgi:hypothetical protein
MSSHGMNYKNANTIFPNLEHAQVSPVEEGSSNLSNSVWKSWKGSD